MDYKNPPKRLPAFKMILLVYVGLFLFGFLFCFTACQQKTACNKETLFLEKVGMTAKDDINKTITVDYVNGQKTHLYASDELLFDVILTGFTSPIIFDLKETEKFYIFMQDSCEWVVIDNHVNYLREECIVKPVPALPELVTGGIMVIPSEFIKEATSVRIVSKGYLLDEDGNKTKPLLAYLDVIILPER